MHEDNWMLLPTPTHSAPTPAPPIREQASFQGKHNALAPFSKILAIIQGWIGESML